MKKICSKCGEEKYLSEFNKDKYMKDGHTSQCKECRRNYLKEYNKSEAGKKRDERYRKTDKRKQYIKEYYEDEENIERRKAWSREYIKQPWVRKKRTDYMRERRRTDELFNLRCRVSSYISSSIRGKNSKNDSSIEILGCDMEFYKQYLEERFQDGMSWDNYGEWHIDHIRPIASFDLSKDDEMRQCFHYTNTQPLWAEENLSKGNKYDRTEV